MNKPEELDLHVKETLGEDYDGIITGWVLCWVGSRFDDDGQILYKHNYMTSPDCDVVRAVGIVDLCKDEIRHDIFGNGIIG